ncbi:hypothetical protein EIN_458890 [Entamoeba invadens IP1]|uniref:Galactose-inhibitable lectin 35 kDa subunit n=1 Tax=Entamoeba invadens IP1 TaxID=370355 RepID=A0A0A1U9E6_ENTIV|nr:hypothetical protein EIN_458890 [Entamoeba invadens IP1]ELP91545.1 hypothetical protein EIN_458890 [Entamoeba invadens IP1]|eukprot:XP_004258316.1 hypothetical protein EIN_458890 [Entamoeba invadens IP1]
MLLIFLTLLSYSLAFTSALGSYYVKYPAPINVFMASNEKYDRMKCTTCCRVLFASDYNFRTKTVFKETDPSTDTRYVMDMEFDDKSLVRAHTGNWEQNILLRPLKMGNELQFWEFASYKMYTSFPIPKRVHDIRGSASIGNTLIIWNKKPPLDAGTKNQRFVYVHPYNDYPSNERYSVYKKHFYIPFETKTDLCYQTKDVRDSRSTWDGNKNLVVLGSSFQIAAQRCKASEAKQIFTPIFA